MEYRKLCLRKLEILESTHAPPPPVSDQWTPEPSDWWKIVLIFHDEATYMYHSNSDQIYLRSSTAVFPFETVSHLTVFWPSLHVQFKKLSQLSLCNFLPCILTILLLLFHHCYIIYLFTYLLIFLILVPPLVLDFQLSKCHLVPAPPLSFCRCTKLVF